MDTEDDRGPRSTRDAHAALRGDIARRLLASPSSLPQPWNEDRPGGWPVADAVFVYIPDALRGQVSLQLGLRNEGVPFPDILERLAHSGWTYLRQRLSTGELSATGIRDGSTEPVLVSPSTFDSAEFDHQSGSVLVGSARLLGVRVFGRRAPLNPGPVPKQPSASQRGGVDETYDWDEFRRELLRAAFAGELSDRRDIRRHMKDWCSRNWDQQPDESRIRQVLKPLLHVSIPEKSGNRN